MHDARLIGAMMRVLEDRRAEPRHRVMDNGTRYGSFGENGLPDATMIGIAIIDISQSGFMALVPRPPAIGEHLVLDINGLGTVHGDVIWRNDNAIGCKFERRLQAHELETVLAAHSAAII